MQIEVSENKIEKVSSDIVLLFTFQKGKTFETTEHLKKIDKLLDGNLINALKLEMFKGKEGSTVSLFTNNKLLSPRVMVVGLGEQKDFTPTVLRKVVAGVTKKLHKSTNSISVAMPEDSSETIIRMMAEGFLLGNYKYNHYLKKDPEEKEIDIVILTEVAKVEVKNVTKYIDETHQLFQAVKLARDLVNEQAAVATPAYLAKVAEDIAKSDPSITVKVYDEKECKKMGMEAFLGIARAASAETPPRFIHLEYTPKGYKGDKKVALVGKGITFDTGGISIKPEKYMADMKMDMAGAAAVLAVFSIIAHVKPNVPVMGLIAATPNLISASSLVPGDVVRAMNGKTIEILNTDAEGRVTLADSMSYATKNGATEIVDLATLTGACMVALGTDYAALYSNNDDLKNRVMKAAQMSGEKVWEMPLVKEYKKLNKSDVADISNLASSMWGGSITAALFIEEFVDEKPWVHLDIAGPAFAEGEFELGPKGGTGFGVGMLISYLSMV
jgi:leucyl aminopeptidase